MKILFTTVLLFLTIIFIFINYQNTKRINNILSLVIGADNLNFITKLDSESVFLGVPITSEFYAFIIYDTSKINCNVLKDSVVGNKKLIDFDKKYINEKEFYCEKIFSDNINTKMVLIQNDILILKIYTD